MADKSIYSTSIGVLKFSHKKAGYPAIKEIAKEWLKDPNFYQIVIRKTSKDDFGIQFIYFAKDKRDVDFMNKYINPYKDLIYAYDVAHQSGDKEDALDGILRNVLIK